MPVKVVRDGAYTTVPRRDVVAGDVVLVEGGEVPADGRLVESVALQVNESKLTGELVGRQGSRHARRRRRSHLSRQLRLPRHHGGGRQRHARRADAVGDATEIGQTARAAAEDTDEKSPLNQQLERLSKWIGVAGFAIAVVTFLALVARAALTAELVLTSGAVGSDGRATGRVRPSPWSACGCPSSTTSWS